MQRHWQSPKTDAPVPDLTASAPRPPAKGTARTPRLELAEFFPHRLSVTQLQVSKALAELYAQRFRLNRSEWRVMAVLGAAVQPMSANDICAQSSLDKVQVSRGIQSMLTRGLVSRRHDDLDRRRILVRLAPQGERIYRRIVPLVLEREAELMSVFSDQERAIFDEYLARLKARAIQLVGGANVEGVD